MNEDETLRTGLYLLALLRAALRQTPAPPRPESVSWEQVWMLAQSHRVEALAAHAILTLEDKPPQEIWQRWKDIPALTVYRESLYQLEWQKISEALRQENLRFIPLKGEALSALYPQAGMRYAGDRDVLYSRMDGMPDAETFRRVKRVMESLGYRLHAEGPVHDVFIKPPFFFFEMHKRLFGSWRHFGDGRSDPWTYAETEDGYLWHFSEEHRFIYFMAHACKHFENCGCGIRLLTDVYVCLQHIRGQAFDWKAVRHAFRALEMETFAEQIIALAEHCFSQEAWSPDPPEEALLLTMLTSGLYGSVGRMLRNLSMRHFGKVSPLRIRLILLQQALFPPHIALAHLYPVLEKRRWLTPLCWVHRCLRLLFSPGKVLAWFRKPIT